MARPRTPAKQRVLALCEWDDAHFHLIWKAKMVRGKPRLAGADHPLRVLLELDSPRIRLKRTCTNPRCINEDHHRITLAQDHKYGDLPPPTWRHPTKGLSVHDYEEIEDLLRSNITPEELLQYPTRIQNEISLRRKTTP